LRAPGLRLSPPVFCYVTDRHSLATAPSSQTAALLEKIRAAIDAGVDWIQIREKDLPPDELLSLAQRAVGAGGNRSTRIIVNHRLDVALAAHAAGVHLGRESQPVAEAVAWCRQGNAPPDFLVGVSCHSVEEVREAGGAGASYVIFGPIFDTPSKRAYGPPAGIAKLNAVCAAVSIPVLAIGGVDLQNAGECLQARAAGIAAIRMFQDAENIEDLRITIRALREL
jgi:thiamine-phosphate pyrophosphorylase